MILLALLFFAQAQAAEPTVEDFHAAFARAEEKIEAQLPELSADIAKFRLSELAGMASVEATDEILIVSAGASTQESVAVNEPATRRVLVNRARWAAVGSELTKEAIALHEILSLAGAESTGAYPFASRYLARFGGRSDGAYLIAGRDPGVPAWKSRRVSCEKRFEYIDRRTGQLHKDSTFGLAAVAQWKIRGKTYGLQFTFGSEVETLQTVIPFDQTVTEAVGRDGEGRVYQIDQRLVLRSINDYLYYEKPRLQFVQEENGSESRRYAYERGRRGAHRETSLTSETEDGSLRLRTDQLLPHPDKGVKTTVSRDECVMKQLPEGEWIAITGEPTIVESFKELDKLAAAANAALLQPGFSGAGATPEERAFLSAWDRLFEAAIKKTRAVRYRPEKGVRGSILAAGRKPAPMPREIRERALRTPPASAKAILKVQAKPLAKPAPKSAARANPRACGVATKPTFIPAPDGGSPILRMEGQSLCLDEAARAGIRALNAYKRKQAR